MITKASIVTELFNVGASETETELKIYNEDGTLRDLTAEELAQVNAEYDIQLAAYNNNQYQRDRADAYPRIEEQLDMQYWDSVNGTTTWADAIAQVKSDNPKP